MKASSSSSVMSMQKHLPLIAMIITQFAYAGMSVLSKAAISSGMKPSIFIAYRQGIAMIVMAPFAFFFERKTASSPTLTWYMLGKLFIVSSMGMTLSLNLYYAALNHVSATFATATTNTIPTLVFIISVCLRIEMLAITKRHGMAKVFGTILGLSGAMAFTFYKGPVMHFGSYYKNHGETHNSSTNFTYTKQEWIKGSILLLASNLSWSMWLIMQSPILKEYPAKLRSTTIQCGFSCLITTIYGAIRESDISLWKLNWNIHLISVAYSGIVVTAITYTLQVWAVEKKGPVFTAMFSPLALVVTAVSSALFLNETLHWGSGLGATLLVSGLYCFLWGKNREARILKQQKHEISGSEAHLDAILITNDKSTQKI